MKSDNKLGNTLGIIETYQASDALVLVQNVEIAICQIFFCVH